MIQRDVQVEDAAIAEVISEARALLPDVKGKLVQYEELVARPLKFASAYLELATHFEKNELKMFTALPLKTSFVPGHFHIDTTILCTKVLGLSTRATGKLTAERKKELWGTFFRMDSRMMKEMRRSRLPS
jgi:hypothetical protein